MSDQSNNGTGPEAPQMELTPKQEKLKAVVDLHNQIIVKINELTAEKERLFGQAQLLDEQIREEAAEQETTKAVEAEG